MERLATLQPSRSQEMKILASTLLLALHVSVWGGTVATNLDRQYSTVGSFDSVPDVEIWTSSSLKPIPDRRLLMKKKWIKRLPRCGRCKKWGGRCRTGKKAVARCGVDGAKGPTDLLCKDLSEEEIQAILTYPDATLDLPECPQPGEQLFTGEPYTGDFCNYDPEDYDIENLPCCNGQEYHPDEQECVNDTLLDLAKCDGKRFNPSLQLCCSGKLRNIGKREPRVCCGKAAYEPSKGICCGGKVTRIKSAASKVGVKCCKSKVCCGKKKINLRRELCCAGKKSRVPKGKGAPVCCGNKACREGTDSRGWLD